jgi:hypothetical protein
MPRVFQRLETVGEAKGRFWGLGPFSSFPLPSPFCCTFAMNSSPTSFPSAKPALTECRRALPELDTALRHHPDGTPYIVTTNPHPGGLFLRIDLDQNPAIHFGPHHDHYDPTADGWRDLLGDVRKIVSGTLLSCTATDADASWKWHTFLDNSTTPLDTDADAFRFLVDSQWNPATGELLVRSARVGAVLDAIAWNPIYNRHFALTPDWFQTVTRPTGLDYLLAAVEVQSTLGGSLLEAFSFDVGDNTYECRRDATRWVLRPAPWTCPPRKCRLLASAPTLDTLLALPLPPPANSTIRDALSVLPAWDIAISRARGEDDTAWTIETPLDPIGLCGLFDDWTKCPAHYRSVVLRPDEAAAVHPVFDRLNTRLGTRIDHATNPQILPSHLVPSAFTLLRTEAARRRTPSVRSALSKLLPVFETATSLNMPISFHL